LKPGPKQYIGQSQANVLAVVGSHLFQMTGSPTTDAEKEIGRGEEYGGRYKYYSKFAHPTALWIVLIEPMPNHMFDGAYAEGARFAEKCLNECERAVAEKYPRIVKRTE
jgi:hypothetical protein